MISKMDAQTHLALEEKVVEMLKTVFDPEIPVDIYSLGLIYKIDLSDEGNLTIDMTMTAPSCPMADFIVEDARLKLEYRWHQIGDHQCGFRARMEPRHDERGGKA